MDSVAIVGNGPSLLKHEFGADIDSHDVIVRIKDGYIRKDLHSLSLGKRGHIICRSNRSHGGPIENYKRWIFVDSRDPLDKDKGLKFGGDVICDTSLCRIWVERYCALREAYDPAPNQKRHGLFSDKFGHQHPSAGSFSILYAMDKLSPDVLRLYGFENVISGTHTWSLTRGEGHPGYPDHNWPAEKRLLEAMCKHYGYNYSLSEGVACLSKQA